MASHPPARCCTVGVKHEGEPTGTKTKIAGKYDAYIAEAKGENVHKDSAILLIPDVISIWQNSMLIADQYAANGYYTMIIDPFEGDALSLNRAPGFDFMKWRNNHGPEKIDPIIEAAIKDLKGKGYKKIGGVGYCFGAKYVARFMASGKGIDVGYCAHPSFVTEDEVKAITGPFSISAAETDAIFSVELRHKTEELFRAGKNPWQINLFSGVEHGFSVRCDTQVPHQKFAKEQAFFQAVTWFDEHLK